MQNSVALSKRNVLSTLNALQSQAMKQYELAHALAAGHEKHLDEAVRTLRRKLHKKLERQAFGNVLKQVLDSVNGNTARAYAVLRAATQQARRERSGDEQQLFGQPLKQLQQRFGRQARPLLGKGRFSSKIEDPIRRDRVRGLSSVALSGRLSVLELTRAISDNEEEEGGFAADLGDILVDLNHRMATASDFATPQQLRTLMKAKGTALFVKELHTSSHHLLGEMRSKNPAMQLDTPGFLTQLQQLIGKGMDLKDTLLLTQKIGGNRLDHQLAFINRLLAMLQEQKYMIWSDGKAREKALSNVLMLSTALVNEEQKRLKESLV
ncbi:TyeA family type III secretion system gatekeeper subunit [Pseudomonas sp. LRF_L74]|uniref:TyeA family type III secretion system gatekeeper subunit n=1 Tax=Pseudomonas sp. LRF_L74 TaxID=3369422 RepID=UPI003F5DDAA3